MSHQPPHQTSNVSRDPNDPPIITIDLITFASDGTHHFPTTLCLLPDAQYLPVLSDVFNMHGYGALTHSNIHSVLCLLSSHAPLN
ncbi:hypothetical protein D6D01_06296 [Aureobasidium pullulans]|uniref:Uncharacterized protein n=1 Tax=Aureobasidium pullulans TaxID=5580 RepID=A0A4V4JUQ1_AURPU|nr:hypothetical protein D6D01_06296 [Aureobasidium pullulans]